MSRKLEDAAIFFDTSGYALIQIPPSLHSPGGFAKIAEKLLTTQVVLRRFSQNCKRLIEEARRVETGSVAGYPLKGLPYTRFGTLRGQELLLREVESDWVTLLHAASSLEDMICNLAAEWSLSGHAWLHCAENTTGKDQARRLTESKDNA